MGYASKSSSTPRSINSNEIAVKYADNPYIQAFLEREKENPQLRVGVRKTPRGIWDVVIGGENTGWNPESLTGTDDKQIDELNLFVLQRNKEGDTVRELYMEDWYTNPKKIELSSFIDNSMRQQQKTHLFEMVDGKPVYEVKSLSGAPDPHSEGVYTLDDYVKAKRKVGRRGDEYGALFDRDGNVMTYVKGNNKKVSWSPTALDDLEANPKMLPVLVHNHPNDSPLSVKDFSAVTTSNQTDNIHGTVAVGDKYAYYMYKDKDYQPYRQGMLMDEIRESHRKTDMEYQEHLAKQFNPLFEGKASYDPQTNNISFHHLEDMPATEQLKLQDDVKKAKRKIWGRKSEDWYWDRLYQNDKKVAEQYHVKYVRYPTDKFSMRDFQQEQMYTPKPEDNKRKLELQEKAKTTNAKGEIIRKQLEKELM